MVQLILIASNCMDDSINKESEYANLSVFADNTVEQWHGESESGPG